MIGIIVLAGGSQKNESIESLPIWVKLRLDKAYEIYNNHKDVAFILSSAGTPHRKPYINEAGYHIYECDSMANYLIHKYDVDPIKIYREYISYDTIGNAFFTKFNFVEPLKIINLYVITSQFHMERTKIIFDFIYQNISFNNDFSGYFKYNIEYIETENGDVSKEDLERRLLKEQNSINSFKNKIKIQKLRDYDNFVKWIYQHHDAYSTEGMIQHKFNFNNKNKTNSQSLY